MWLNWEVLGCVERGAETRRPGQERRGRKIGAVLKRLLLKPLLQKNRALTRTKPGSRRSFSCPGREPAPLPAHGRALTQSCHLRVGSATRKSIQTARNRAQELWVTRSRVPFWGLLPLVVHSARIYPGGRGDTYAKRNRISTSLI